jgi:plasmid stabilization system protein ParE
VASRTVRWSDAAQRDLADIVDYIAGDSELNAEGVLTRLQSQAESLAQFAERARRIPELRGRKADQQPDWRELLVRPWRIVFAIEGDSVLVLAVVDGRCDFRSWLARRSPVDLSRPNEQG